MPWNATVGITRSKVIRVVFPGGLQKLASFYFRLPRTLAVGVETKHSQAETCNVIECIQNWFLVVRAIFSSVSWSLASACWNFSQHFAVGPIGSIGTYWDKLSQMDTNSFQIWSHSILFPDLKTCQDSIGHRISWSSQISWYHGDSSAGKLWRGHR